MLSLKLLIYIYRSAKFLPFIGLANPYFRGSVAKIFVENLEKYSINLTFENECFKE